MSNSQPLFDHRANYHYFSVTGPKYETDPPPKKMTQKKAAISSLFKGNNWRTKTGNN